MVVEAVEGVTQPGEEGDEGGPAVGGEEKEETDCGRDHPHRSPFLHKQPAHNLITGGIIQESRPLQRPLESSAHHPIPKTPPTHGFAIDHPPAPGQVEVQEQRQQPRQSHLYQPTGCPGELPALPPERQQGRGDEEDGGEVVGEAKADEEGGEKG